MLAAGMLEHDSDLMISIYTYSIPCPICEYSRITVDVDMPLILDA